MAAEQRNRKNNAVRNFYTNRKKFSWRSGPSVLHDEKHRQPKGQDHQAEIEQFQSVDEESTLYFVHDRSLLAGLIYEFLVPLLVRYDRLKRPRRPQLELEFTSRAGARSRFRVRSDQAPLSQSHGIETFRLNSAPRAGASGTTEKIQFHGSLKSLLAPKTRYDYSF
jgi:hypothetical protein